MNCKDCLHYKDDFFKIVFPTREKAEKALEKKK